MNNLLNIGSLKDCNCIVCDNFIDKFPNVNNKINYLICYSCTEHFTVISKI
ncbi:MAG: hypothetical protein U0354_12405 [Candidatus Sericytochromatia bacterium]